MIRQITSQLLNPTERLKVQLSVGISDSRGNSNYCSMYNSGGMVYINVTPYIQLTIKYFEPTRRWTKLDNINLTQRTIFAVRSELKDFYSTLLKNEQQIYTYDNHGYISSMGNTNQFSRIIPVDNTQAMRLEPTALYINENGKPIPGVSIEINCKENRAELSISEFESFYDVIQTTNIHQEGMILLQMYMTMCLKNGGLVIPVEEGSFVKQPSPKDVKVNIFQKAQERRQKKEPDEQEYVSGPNIKQITKLEDL